VDANACCNAAVVDPVRNFQGFKVAPCGGNENGKGDKQEWQREHDVWRGLQSYKNFVERYLKTGSLKRSMKKIFHVIIEQDEDGVYIGKVPELKGCLSQGSTLDELMKNIKEAIELCLEVQSATPTKIDQESIKFVGVQEVEV